MTDTTIDLTPVSRSDAFWIGWLSKAVELAANNLAAVDVTTGKPAWPREKVVADLVTALEAYCGSEVAHDLTNDGACERLYDGFVVEAATGEPQALARTQAEARRRLAHAEAYWSEAERCGHPSAPGYVARLRPFRVRQITRAERAEIIEDGTPVLDREP